MCSVNDLGVDQLKRRLASINQQIKELEKIKDDYNEALKELEQLKRAEQLNQEIQNGQRRY